jgi:hypothetical protein
LSFSSDYFSIGNHDAATNRPELLKPPRISLSTMAELPIRPETDSAPRKAARIPAFDFTKGMLVLFMVLYHWLNYFYGPTGSIYKYLRFLTPSFIFITGFLISYVLFAKYEKEERQLSQRLLIRGAKILAVFVSLNLLIALISLHNSALLGFLEHSPVSFLKAVFITGDVYGSQYGKAASFGVLVPIGYLLLASAVLLSLTKVFQYIFHVCFALSVVSIIMLSRSGIYIPNLELLSIGLFGVVCGLVPAELIQQFVNRKYTLMVAYVAYLAAATIWDVPFGLRIIGVVLTLSLLYILGSSDVPPKKVKLHICLLGSYSLFGYISQIALLQLLHSIFSRFNLGFAGLFLSFVAGFGLTMLSVEVVNRARRMSPIANRAYTAIFA